MKCHTGRGAHYCLQSALLGFRDFHMEYTMSQDNISSSEVKLPCHLLPAAYYRCSPSPGQLSFHAKASWLSLAKLWKNDLWQKQVNVKKVSQWSAFITPLWPELITRSERVKQGRRDSQAFSSGCQQAAEAAQPCCHAISGDSSICCSIGEHSLDLKQMIPIKVLP